MLNSQVLTRQPSLGGVTRQVAAKAHQGQKLAKAFDNVKKVAQSTVACGMTVLMLQSGGLPAQTQAEEFVRIPLSVNKDIQKAQTKLLETWAIASDLFYDASIDDSKWTELLVNGLADQIEAESGEQAASVVDNFLAKLGDPYTRIESPDSFTQFRAASDGELQGVGMVISSDSSTGRVLVLAPVKGGPADRAGIKPGDEVVRIDGMPVQGMTGEQAAQYLRGLPGTQVTITIQRLASQPSLQAAAPEQLVLSEVAVQRELVLLSPVQWTMLAQGRDNVGYIKLTNFSQQAGVDMEAAVAQLKMQGAKAYILDLRNNPGGLVNSAIDVAQQWLQPGSAVVNVLDGRLDEDELAGSRALQETANLMEYIVQPNIPGHVPAHQISTRFGGSISEPLVVLVNKGSASAAEILAGALQDNGRAVVIGDPTYGKGKIQGVFPLADGSGLFLTVAKYETPNFKEIDTIGVQPDHTCGVRPVVAPQSFTEGQPGRVLNGSFDTVVDLDNDPCITTAEADLHRFLTQPAPALMRGAPTITAQALPK